MPDLRKTPADEAPREGPPPGCGPAAPRPHFDIA